MIMLSAAAHITQAHRRPLMEQAAAVKVRIGNDTDSRTEYVTQPGRGALFPLHKKIFAALCSHECI